MTLIYLHTLFPKISNRLRCSGPKCNAAQNNVKLSNCTVFFVFFLVGGEALGGVEKLNIIKFKCLVNIDPFVYPSLGVLTF